MPRAVGGRRRRFGNRGPRCATWHLPDRRIHRRRRLEAPRRRGSRPPFRVDRRGGARPMSMPFYVAPEQMMKDRADYARKGIARGRSVVVLQYDEGIAFATENPSRALHKVS